MASRMNSASPLPDFEVLSVSRTASVAYSLGCTENGEPFDTVIEPEEESVQVDARIKQDMEKNDIEVIYQDVKSPCSTSQNILQKWTKNLGKELDKFTVANRRLTKENESLIKELKDWKLEVAKQRSQNISDRQAHSNQVLDVLNAELTCAICSDIIIDATAIDCGHIFCSYCISTWLSQQANSKSCPTCRAVTYNDSIKIYKLSNTIASFHKLLSPEAQFDRRHALQDRKIELKAAEEASESQDQWSRNLSQAHDRATESVRHLRGLSPGANEFEGDLPGQDQPSYVQAHVESYSNLSSTPPSEHYSRPLYTPLPFLDESLTLQPQWFYASPESAATQTPSNLTTLPLASSSANNQGQAASGSLTPSVLSRYFPDATIFDHEVTEMTARLQQVSPSVYHHFHNRDPRQRRGSC